METISKIAMNLTEREQERLLAFGEGVAFMASQHIRSEQAQRPGA